jgi:ATP P2X receptor
MLAIFGYIVGYVLILQKKYLELEVPVGTVYTSLEKPATNTWAGNYTYCDLYKENHGGHTTWPDPLPCIVGDANEVQFPADELDAIMITTRLSTTKQRKLCLDPKQPCRKVYGDITNKSSIYYAAVEEYTIRVSHSMQAQKFFDETHDSQYAAAGTEMYGELQDIDGRTLQKFTTSSDIVSMGMLLKAAHLSMEQISQAEHAGGETKRHGGAVVLVTITYTNTDGAFPSYVMRPSFIPKAEYKATEIVKLTDTDRLQLDRHGTKFVFVTSGSIGRFNFQTMLIQLVSALGLLSVASLVVEIMMLYILPHKRYYQKYKYQETVDFSDVRDSEKELGSAAGGGTGANSMNDEEFSDSMHYNLTALRQPLM